MSHLLLRSGGKKVTAKVALTCDFYSVVIATRKGLALSIPLPLKSMRETGTVGNGLFQVDLKRRITCPLLRLFSLCPDQATTTRESSSWGWLNQSSTSFPITIGTYS